MRTPFDDWPFKTGKLQAIPPEIRMLQLNYALATPRDVGDQAIAISWSMHDAILEQHDDPDAASKAGLCEYWAMKGSPDCAKCMAVSTQCGAENT